MSVGTYLLQIYPLYLLLLVLHYGLTRWLLLETHQLDIFGLVRTTVVSKVDAGGE